MCGRACVIFHSAISCFSDSTKRQFGIALYRTRYPFKAFAKASHDRWIYREKVTLFRVSLSSSSSYIFFFYFLFLYFCSFLPLLVGWLVGCSLPAKNALGEITDCYR